MKSVAFFISKLRYGGAERVMVNLANAFAKDDYDVHFITTVREKEEYELLPAVHRLVIAEEVKLSSCKVISVAQEVQFIRKVIRAYKSECLISFMANNNFRDIVACWGVKTKAIISVRNDPRREYYSPMLRTVMRLLFPLANGIVFQTQEEKNYFPQFIQRKSVIIYNPVRQDFFDAPTRVGECKEVVSVGRLEPQKNFRMLIHAFAKIANIFPDYRLVIYGGGTMHESLAKDIADSGMVGRICLAGTTKDVKTCLAKAEIFVMPSNFEGLPNALMEAMTVGKPVIATDCPAGGPRELIKNGGNGLLVPVGDEAAMAQAMTKLLREPELRKSMGDAARKTAESFRPECILQKWQDFIRET